MQAGLIADAAGDLFGTGTLGGANGDGAAFEIAKASGSYASTPTTLVSFNPNYGFYPVAGLVADAAGDLFGTTQAGGAHDDGTVFEIAKTGGSYASTPTTLVSFNRTDGSSPDGGLIADAAGDLFGTTADDGANGGGTVFELVNNGGGSFTLVTLVSFNGVDGDGPKAGLIANAAGDLFGTTAAGGASGDGTVFEIAKAGGSYAGAPTTLASFNVTDGADPRAGLIADAAGDLFGTTDAGGTDGDGTVFELVNNDGGSYTLVTLVSFNGAEGDGPEAGLIADAAGNLFGTTQEGGAYGDGTVFEIAKAGGSYAGTPTTLLSFNVSDGEYPQAGLIADEAGDLFGTTSGGGATGAGTAFELSGTGFQVPTDLTVISDMPSPLSGDEGPGKTLTLTLSFSAAVMVSGGKPSLTLNNGGTATYRSGSGSTALTFTYKIGALGSAQNASALAVTGVVNGTTIKDLAGNAADLSNAPATFTGLQVDTAAPTVISDVPSPLTGDEGPGKVITITLNFNEAVKVSGGKPSLTLNDGGTATYKSDSDTNILTFTYKVGATDLSEAALAVTGVTNGANIKDLAGNVADMSNAPATFSGLQIDTTPPTVTSDVPNPPTGDEGAGKVITIKLDFSEVVTIKGGTPSLILNDGGTATYKSGSGTNSLTFTYKIGAADLSEAALAVTGVLNGTTIEDLAGNVADVSNAPATFNGLQIDTAPPTVTSDVPSPLTGDEGVGKVITITLDFSEVVTLKGGAPSLILNDGATATYKSGAGTSALTFTYKVGASDLNEAALAVTGVANGTTIEDLAGNIADLSGASATFEGLKIDTSIPTVVSAAADPGDFDEDVGGKVTITVNLSEPGYVSGRPLLILNDGGIAKYASGSGTDMLTFDYTVGSGDSDVSALAIVDFQVAGHIKDGAGKSFDLSGALTTFDGLQIKSGSSAYTYTTLNDGDPRSVSTYAQGINNVGQVVGLGSTQDGFLYSDGLYSVIADPLASVGGNGTYAYGINDADEIVGAYYNDNVVHGFVYSNGTYTTLDNPLANSIGNGSGTILEGINNSGQIVGYYDDSSLISHGFIYSNGAFDPIDGPPGSIIAIATGINNNGQIVGGYFDSNRVEHGFLYDQGTYTTIDPLGAKVVEVDGINDAGQMVGFYETDDNKQHGFLYSNGSYTTLNFPLNSSTNTRAYGIDDSGQIAGFEFNNLGVQGFVASEGIDLTDISFGPSTTLGYSANPANTGGTISVNDGAHSAAIAVLGQYLATDFHIASDFNGGTVVTDPTLTGAALNAFLASSHT